MKVITNTQKKNATQFLRNSIEDEVMVRSTFIEGSFNDLQSKAQSAGFKVYRVRREDLVPKGQFAEFYHFVRK